MGLAQQNITPGQAPGNNQVNLGNIQTGLKNTLAPGMLGNNIQNPMDQIIQAGGQSQMGIQNAMANSRMQDMILQAKMQELQQQKEQYEQNQQQPGILDFLGLGASGAGLLSSLLKGGKGSQGGASFPSQGLPAGLPPLMDLELPNG
jgi:hypothetical protein